MTVSATYGLSISAGGMSIQSSIIRSSTASIAIDETMSAAKSGTLTTRTDDNTGELTMAASHGITTGQIIDIYSAGPVVHRKSTVGTVATNAVPIDLGIGDVLPADETAITAMVRQNVNCLIDGDNCKLLAILLKTVDTTLTTAGHVSFYDASDNEIAELDLVANIPRVYDLEGGATNPFTGAPITYARISHAGTSATEVYKFQVLGVYDASP